MQQTIEQEAAASLSMAGEWRRFRQWADEARSTSPFGELAVHWHAGHLTIEEGRRIEREQHLARFLTYVARFLKST